MSDTQNPDIPSGDVGDDDYVSRVGQKTQEPVPVQSDNDTVEAADDDVVDKDSDAQLGSFLPTIPFHLASLSFVVFLTSSDRLSLSYKVLPRVQPS